MKLIAKKPCSFGGRKFFIGDEIPSGLVISPKNQAMMGVLAIREEEEKAVRAKPAKAEEPRKAPKAAKPLGEEAGEEA